MATKFLTNNWRQPKNANQDKNINFSKSYIASSLGTGWYEISGDPLFEKPEFTFSFWSNRPDSISMQGILTKWINSGSSTNEYIFRFSTTGILQVYAPTARGLLTKVYFDTDAPNAPLWDKWIHYAFVKKENELKLYIDGYLAVVDTSSVYAGSFGTDNNDVRLGSYAASALLGNYAEYIFYPKALSAGENILQNDPIDADSDIGKLYNKKSPFSLSINPHAYYNFDTQLMAGQNFQIPNSAIGNFVIETPNTAGANIVLPTQSDLGLSNASKMSFSIWYWIDSSTANSSQALFGWNYGDANGGGFYIWRSGNTALRVVIGNDDLPGGPFRQVQSNIGDSGNLRDQWQHLVVVFDGTQTDNNLLERDAKRFKMYLNGQDVTYFIAGTVGSVPSVLANGGTNGSGNRNLRIGSLEFGNTSLNYPWLGKLSNAQIWNESLSSEEVATIYNYGSPLTVMPSGILDDNNIAWYKMDGTSSFDSNSTSWSFPNATIDYIKPNYKKALLFDGQNNYISVGSNNLGTSLTVSAWVNLSSYGNIVLGGSNASGSPNSYIFYITSSTQITAANFDGNYSTYNNIPPIDLNKWYHLVLVRNGADGELFINGQSVGSNTNDFGSSDFYLEYLGGQTPTSFNWEGLISNVSAWNSILQPSQIETLYNLGTPEDEISFSPVSWWKLDDNQLGIQNSASTLNSALSFSTTLQGVVSLDSDIDLSGNSSVSIWFKGNTIDSNGDVMLGGSQTNPVNYFPYINQATLYVRGINGTKSISYSFSEDIWYNICITQAPSLNPILYINGELQGTMSGGAAGNTQTVINTIGSYSNNLSRTFGGNISNVQVFNSTLSAPDVKTLHNAGSPLADMSSFNSLVSWWKLDNRTTGIQDSKGSNNGSLALTTGPLKQDVFVSSTNGLNSTPSAYEIPTEVVTTPAEPPAVTSMYTANSRIIDSLITQTGYSNSSLKWPSASADLMYTSTTPFGGSGITGDFTISCWIKHNGVNNPYDPIVSSQQPNSSGTMQIALALRYNELYFFYNGSSSAHLIKTKNSVIQGNKWYHVAFIRAGNTGSLFVDGELAPLDDLGYNVDFTQSPIVSSDDLKIGGWILSSTPSYFQGNISNLTIHDTAFSTLEMKQLYNNGIVKDVSQGPNKLNLKHWWPLDANNSMWDADGSRWYSRDLKNANYEGIMSNSDVSYMSGDSPNSFLNATTSTNLDITTFEGDGPDSKNNSYSINMGYGAKQTL